VGDAVGISRPKLPATDTEPDDLDRLIDQLDALKRDLERTRSEWEKEQEHLTVLEQQSATAAEELPPLHFSLGRFRPTRWLIVSQTLVGLGGILAGAELFVGACTDFAGSIALSPLILSLIVAPVATELPEQLNSVLWIRQGKDVLALGNITGAMVFQSTLPPALGIALTAWHLEPRALLSVGLALFSAVFLVAMIRMRRKLTAGVLLTVGSLYAGYLIALPWFGTS